jgi:hypothetical protein
MSRHFKIIDYSDSIAWFIELWTCTRAILIVFEVELDRIGWISLVSGFICIPGSDVRLSPTGKEGDARERG